MAMVIGVRFKRAGKVYFFDPGENEIHAGGAVIVETARGVEYGEVVAGNHEVEEEQIVQPLRTVIRVATEQDTRVYERNLESERTAYGVCQDKIGQHGLEMKLVDVEYAFDGSKIIFYFTANGRVDFRALVKDLASVFKTRIELRQIGVRDEAKMLGGLGPCGRPICCGQFLSDFQPVSIKMAKEQNLSLNPTKISGLCGRLMCCLKYEQDHYEKTRKKMPRVGRDVITPEGVATVVDVNVLTEKVKVRVQQGDSFEMREYCIDECRKPDLPRNVNAAADAQRVQDVPPQAQADAPAEEDGDAAQKPENARPEKPARAERAPREAREGGSKRDGRGGRPFGAKGEKRVRTAENAQPPRQEQPDENPLFAKQPSEDELLLAPETEAVLMEEDAFIVEKAPSEEIELDLDAQLPEEEDEQFSD